MLTRAVVWREETLPRQWRGGLPVNLFKKGYRENPGNYVGITLLSVVGRVFCKVLHNGLVHCLDKGVLLEGQAGFRVNRNCMHNVYTLNEIVQGRLKKDKDFLFSRSHDLTILRAATQWCTDASPAATGATLLEMLERCPVLSSVLDQTAYVADDSFTC